MDAFSLLLPASIRWDVSPTMFSVGGFELRWYGLMFAFAFLLGHYVLRRVYQVEGRPPTELDRITFAIILAVVFGARFAHCVFYDPHYYFVDYFDQYRAYADGFRGQADLPTTWGEALGRTILRVVNLREGGLASHGAAMGILLAIWLLARRLPNMSFLWLSDRLVLTIPLGGALVRFGNLFNSEVCGLHSSLPWAFEFIRGGSDCGGPPRHPTQLYEALLYVGLFFLLWRVYMKYKRETPQGLLLGLLMAVMFAGRFLIEFLKVDQEEYQHALPFNTGQLLSLPFVAIGLWLVWRALKRPAQSPQKLPSDS